jgi:tetratricopeptide (TPR) repeat protein
MVTPPGRGGRAAGEEGSMRSTVPLIALALCVLPSLVSAEGSAIVRGDELYARGLLTDARSVYQSALTQEPNSFGALCRLARVESELGEDAKGEEQRQLLAAAVEHARAAVKAAPDSGEGHVWLATTLGRQALHEGPKTKLALAREVKSEVDRGLTLDPTIARGYHVRGVWNRDIAKLGVFERTMAGAVGGVPKGATAENAVRDLSKAVELEPNYVNHRLELGRTYMIFHDNKNARRELERAVSLPPTSSARDARYQAEAKELLAKLPKSH